MPRKLFTVAETLIVPGRGIVLVPGIAPVGNERFHVGDPLLLKRPDGMEMATTIGSLEFLCPNPDNEVVVVLHEFGKDDVPVGTEVWSNGIAEP